MSFFDWVSGSWPSLYYSFRSLHTVAWAPHHLSTYAYAREKKILTCTSHGVGVTLGVFF